MQKNDIFYCDQLLAELTQFVRIIHTGSGDANFLDIPELIPNNNPTEISILGGFARRLYMLKNDIKMKPKDYDGLYSSDIDIFIDMMQLFPTELHYVVTSLHQMKKSSDLFEWNHLLASVTDQYKKLTDDLVDGGFEILSVSVMKKNNESFEEYKDRALNNMYNNIYKWFNITALNLVCYILFLARDIIKNGHLKDSEIKKLGIKNSISYRESNIIEFPLLQEILTPYSEDMENLGAYINSTISTGSEIKVNVNPAAGFNVSVSNLSICLPLGDRLQLIFKSATMSDLLGDFDMPNSKFEIKYPFDQHEPISYFNGDDIYSVTEMDINGSYSPFRILDRMNKYSKYGFIFNQEVVDIIKDNIVTFIDENDFNKFPTYASSLYYV